MNNGCMRVLGVDPASAGPTGFGVVESDGRCCRVVHYGALKVALKRQKEFAGAVLQEVHTRMCGLIKEFSPDAIALESVFTALNMRTALRLAEVRGVILLAAAQHGVAVSSYAPREVKASVAGHGHADKRQMQLMVQALLTMKEIPEPADAADALAVALCHMQVVQARQRFGLPETTKLARPQASRVSAVSGGIKGKVPESTTRAGISRIELSR
jgi:crossover junction endodeoxyribonuclease RuvC